MANLQGLKKDLISQFIDNDIIKTVDTFVQEQNLEIIEKSSSIIAELFGPKREFSVLVENTASAEKQSAENKLISSFYNNLNLLIQKTWVEKADEALKEQILVRLETLCSEIKKNIYTGSYSAFISVLRDVVYLMFGTQAKKEDFTEYALRIDPGFGIFWWYIECLPMECTWSNEKTRIAMLLAMFFLANY